MDINLKLKIKPELISNGHFDKNGIFILDDIDCVQGNNEKYMKMYNWMSHGYNLFENVIGRLLYGNTIKNTRKANKKYKNIFNLSLVNSCAENLPFNQP